ncbi:hypothetical protein GCM10023350_18470 [Nocardioides endophyticus]|uniref:VOC family protein n=1 Tax=Nocardioides endophyticus TaxID=1353775 RepID=A0ABP8YTR9_9ACTN
MLGFSRVLDFEVTLDYGPPGKPDFWIGIQPEGEGPSSGPNREVHIAFAASPADAVRAFRDAAVSLGPRPRRQQRRGCVSHGGAGVARDTRFTGYP